VTTDRTIRNNKTDITIRDNARGTGTRTVLYCMSTGTRTVLYCTVCQQEHVLYCTVCQQMLQSQEAEM
jgi:hypothetical protein